MKIRKISIYHDPNSMLIQNIMLKRYNQSQIENGVQNSYRGKYMFLDTLGPGKTKLEIIVQYFRTKALP